MRFYAIFMQILCNLFPLDNYNSAGSEVYYTAKFLFVSQLRVMDAYTFVDNLFTYVYRVYQFVTTFVLCINLPNKPTRYVTLPEHQTLPEGHWSLAGRYGRTAPYRSVGVFQT